ncbi:IclR family transcriptional regulator domain-containing protein [Alsobacter sp. R-9]
MSETGRRASDRDLVGGLQNGLAVIEAYDAQNPRLSITDVAKRTGLTRAASRRYLLTLVRLGYAEHDGKFFALTPKVLRLGYAYLSSGSLPSRVQSWLERIAETIQESCSAAVLDGNDVVYIARASTRRIMSIGLGVGSRLPAYCTSLGRVLIAGQPDAWLDHYLATEQRTAFTAKTLTTEAEIRAAVAKAREDGFAVVDEELEVGLRSAAVPVLDRGGRVRCAINVGVQTQRVSLEHLKSNILPRLLAASDELSRLL